MIDVLYNFISPVTGRLPLTEDYILIGGRQGFSVMSPKLIDIELDLININHVLGDLTTTAFILGAPNPKLPLSQDLSSLDNGFMFNTAGNISTTNNLPLPSLPYNNIWVGNINNVAVPKPYDVVSQSNSSFILQTPNPNLPNSQALAFLLGGILKSAAITGVISIAIPDVDYATVATLEELAAEAAISAEEASAAAAEASAAAAEATGAAAEATGAAAEASFSAFEASFSAFEANLSALEASAAAASATASAAAAAISASAAAGSAAESALSATESALSAAEAATSAAAAATSATAAETSATAAAASATDASGSAVAASGYSVAAAASASGAAASAVDAASSASEAQDYLNTLLTTGLSGLPCTGNVSFQGYTLINLGSPVNPTDGANKEYVDNAISGLPYSSLTLQGAITGSGPLNLPVITTLNTTLNQITNAGNVDIGNYNLNNVLSPVNPTDGANKQYVDDAVSSSSNLISLSGAISGSGQTGTVVNTNLSNLLTISSNQTFNFTGSPTVYNYNLTIPNSANKTVCLNMNRANTGNGAGYQFIYYSPTNGIDTFTFGYNSGSQFGTIYSIANNVPLITYNYSLFINDIGTYKPYNGNYGYLNSNGSIGQASGQNSYSINCNNRIKASEFDAVSSQKVKTILGTGAEIEHDAVKLFKQIPLFKYQYKDTIKEGEIDHYGVIAERLAEVIPGFVNMDDEGWVPNIYSECVVDPLPDNEYKLYFHKVLDNINIGKLKLIVPSGKGEKTIQVDIISKDEYCLTVKSDQQLIGCVFAYGTYENCPTVSKQKVFELGLVAVRNLITRVELLEKTLKEEIVC